MDEQPAAKKGPHLLDEADVGSGEKSPGQQDTEALINQIGDSPAALPPAEPAPAASANRRGGDAAPGPDTAVAPPGLRPQPADSASAGPP